ncbi:MAG TPA: TlpA disulfide reductase family protein [Pyrinomonadaceae bacterium]|nr:TlpA disulfide reductase family protein [Pyrinomonadaceae bacterium]
MQKIVFLFFILTFSIAAFGQKKAENFSSLSLDGQTFELENLRGKIVVLTFWSTRCAICQSEIPSLNKMANDFKEKDVVFLAPTLEDETRITPFLKKNPFKFNILPNSMDLVLKYADRDGRGNLDMGFPAHFIINQTGNIELKTSGFDKTVQLNSTISRLLVSK